MDSFTAGFRTFEDGDLMLCPENGIAYQRDMTIRVPYDETYFNKCASYEDQDIARKINAGRIALVNKYAGAKARVVDIGIGSGEFIKKRPNTFGFDVNPAAIEWLTERGLLATQALLYTYDAFTFWDVIEHVEKPEEYFQFVRAGSYLFTCLPIFSDLRVIRESKHYRPGEHLYYWTESGFVQWMALHRFDLIERCDFEVAAGRDSILSFAFRRSDRT